MGNFGCPITRRLLFPLALALGNSVKVFSYFPKCGIGVFSQSITATNMPLVTAIRVLRAACL